MSLLVCFDQSIYFVPDNISALLGCMNRPSTSNLKNRYTVLSKKELIPIGFNSASILYGT